MKRITSAFQANTLIALVLLFFLCSCKKKSSDPPTVAKTGKFDVIGNFGSGNYSGDCLLTANTNSGGKNVGIIPVTADQIIIYNMPSSSSGSVIVKDANGNINTTDPNYVFAVMRLDNSQSKYTVPANNVMTYLSADGSVTKTGANSFTFSMRMYYSLTGGHVMTVTGSGTY